MLSKWLTKSKSTTPPPPPPPPRHLRLRYKDKPVRAVDSEGRVVIDAKAELSVAEHDGASDEEVLYRVRAWVDTLVNNGKAGKRADRIPMSTMHLIDSDDKVDSVEAGNNESEGVVSLLAGGPPVTVDLRSAPLPNPDYRARLTIEFKEDS